MNKLGYKVTVVEMANEPRTAGGTIDIKETTINVAKRMAIYEGTRVDDDLSADSKTALLFQYNCFFAHLL
jgi:2-polyprenyl-6-methoxyphenol hydroxylase-like FAD-dependent oxidoreductase